MLYFTDGGEEEDYDEEDGVEDEEGNNLHFLLR